MKNRIKGAVVAVIASVPFLAAPITDPCGACYGFWKDDLDIYEEVLHQAVIDDGEAYLVQLGLVSGEAELAVYGDVDGVDCFADADGTECTFDAVADGEVSLKISAGAEGAETFLNLDPM
ncbi:MAG: hypothetical protein K0V04_36475 [Deltaproteobacteria bacterium]|nr:hypothetical protein [Deltaproteobacteria bacterium]